MRHVATDGITQSVCMSIRMLGTFMNHTKTAERIEMLFGRVTRVCPRNHLLNGAPDLKREKDNILALYGPLNNIVSHCCVQQCMQQKDNKNSSTDEIIFIAPERKPFYDDIAHVL